MRRTAQASQSSQVMSTLRFASTGIALGCLLFACCFTPQDVDAQLTNFYSACDCSSTSPVGCSFRLFATSWLYTSLGAFRPCCTCSQVIINGTACTSYQGFYVFATCVTNETAYAGVFVDKACEVPVRTSTFFSNRCFHMSCDTIQASFNANCTDVSPSPTPSPSASVTPISPGT
jgi:hypothetical protein